MGSLTFGRRAFVTLFLILAAHSMTETARDALFLARLPVSKLPWMYLLVAVTSILAARGASAAAQRLGHSALPALLLASAGISAAFWLTGATRSHTFLYVLYLWPAVFSSVVVVEFWRIVSDAYTITEAKSIFGRVGAGGTAGSFAGSALAVGVSTSIPPAGLLLAAALLLAVSTLFCPRASGAEPAAPAPAAQGLAGPKPLATVASSRYLTGVAACLFLTTVIATLADFVFKSIVTEALRPDRLVQVFAAVSLAVSAGTLLLQMAFVGPFIRNLGVTRSLMVFPSVISIAGGTILAGTGMAGALFLRITDGTLRYSVHRAVSDLLYVPLTPGVRAQVKAFIDVVSQRGGQVAGSAAILAGLAIGAGERMFAAAIILMGVTIAVVAIRLRQPYLDLFRTTLHKEGTETRLAFPGLDVGSLSSLVSAFSSDDEREVVAAMDLVASQGEVRAIPVVMLFHPSQAVVLRALALFEEQQRQGFLWAVERLSGEGTDPRIRAAALSAYARMQGDPSALYTALADVHEPIRATALVGLVSGGWLEWRDAERLLEAILVHGSSEGRQSLAMAIRIQPSPLFAGALVRLAESSDPGVRAQVAEAMIRMPNPLFLESLRSMLPHSVLRNIARQALVETGAPALRFLADSLDDAAISRTVRLHLPRSISRFDPREAMPVLWRRLLMEPDELIRFKILRGLGRVVADAPEVRPSADAIAKAINIVSRAGLRLACWRTTLAAGAPVQPASETEVLLLRFLLDKQARATESIFRLLGLTRLTEDFERVFRGLQGNRIDRASGRELLENVIPPSERAAVLALADDPIDPIHFRDLRDPEASPTMTYEETITAILRTSSGPLRTIAERRATEIGLGVMA